MHMDECRHTLRCRDPQFAVSSTQYSVLSTRNCRLNTQGSVRSTRILLFAICAVLAAATSACRQDGQLQLLGYTTKPPYYEHIRTVYVPTFQNRAFQAGPMRGLEIQVSESVRKHIEMHTPMKVIQDRERADSELLGAIVLTPKNIINRNQLNEVREGEMVIQVELVWRDLNTGEILSRPAGPLPPNFNPDDPPKFIVQSTGRYLPELGETTTSALKRASDSLAYQIVQLMQKPW